MTPASWFARKSETPASESQKSAVLILCVITMSIMSIAVVWQAQIIANQRQMIQWLETLRFVGS
jgi:hypothetical protein